MPADHWDEAEVADRDKRFLSDQERSRAAQGFVGALAEMGSPPTMQDDIEYLRLNGVLKPACKSRNSRAHPEATGTADDSLSDGFVEAVRGTLCDVNGRELSVEECAFLDRRAAGKPILHRAHPERDPGQPKWNKTEARYAQHLELQKHAHLIVWWAFEGVTLKLAPDTRYTPDFTVMTAEHRLEFHEVKGINRRTGKPRYEDDARVKIAVAAEKFRPLRFLMVWPARNGEWDCKEF